MPCYQGVEEDLARITRSAIGRQQMLQWAIEEGRAARHPDWVRCTVPARRGHSKLEKARKVPEQEERRKALQETAGGLV